MREERQVSGNMFDHLPPRGCLRDGHCSAVQKVAGGGRHASQGRRVSRCENPLQKVLSDGICFSLAWPRGQVGNSLGEWNAKMFLPPPLPTTSSTHHQGLPQGGRCVVQE